ncbi:hypothetical protein ACS0TY_001949 [Phlomoides rotata]
MEVDHVDAEGEEREASTSRRNYREKSHYPGAVRRKAYIFDGDGNYYNKEWDLSEGRGKEFCWYHVELPRENKKLSQSAQYLIDVLCPPLKLQDILSLVSNGPFCGHVDGAVVFRVNSPGPPSRRVPRLGFSPANESLLSEIPVVEGSINGNGGEEGRAGMVIKEHVLDFLLTMNHWEEADNPVPRSVSNLVVHIIDSHMGHLEDVMTKLELELDSVEEHCSSSPWAKWGGPIGCGKSGGGCPTSVGYAMMLRFKCVGQISIHNLGFEVELGSGIDSLHQSRVWERSSKGGWMVQEHCSSSPWAKWGGPIGCGCFALKKQSAYLIAGCFALKKQ